MKQAPPRKVKVYLWQECDWWVAQCLEIDVASQGRSEEDALNNLREALELYFEEPVPTVFPQVRTLELAFA
jgi:predicted RNase H-like HicB family nuclease